MSSLNVEINDPSRVIRVLQITDCHVGPTEEETLLGLNTNESLQDVIRHISQRQQQNNSTPYDLLLTTGDISNNGGARTYHRYLETMRNCAIKYKSFAWLPGNHDSPDDMNEALGASELIKEIQIGGWLIILLNSQVPGHVHGNLSASELDLLDSLLSKNTDKHTLVFMHHHPVPVGCAWLDQQSVRSTYAFFKIIDQYKQVKAIIWGHVHQEFTSAHNDVQLLSTPSTCIQFKINSDDFALDKLMPGYRWFDLKADGTFDTKVERIDYKKYPIEFTSEGY